MSVGGNPTGASLGVVRLNHKTPLPGGGYLLEFAFTTAKRFPRGFAVSVPEDGEAYWIVGQAYDLWAQLPK